MLSSKRWSRGTGPWTWRQFTCEVFFECRESAAAFSLSIMGGQISAKCSMDYSAFELLDGCKSLLPVEQMIERWQTVRDWVGVESRDLSLAKMRQLD